jgi:hypothetical protein
MKLIDIYRKVRKEMPPPGRRMDDKKHKQKRQKEKDYIREERWKED